MLMNFQWQSLLCHVEAGLLKMFGEEEEEEEQAKAGDRPPQYTVQLRGADIIPGPDTDHSYRISLSLHGLQMAVLEVLGQIGTWQLRTPAHLIPQNYYLGLYLILGRRGIHASLTFHFLSLFTSRPAA